MRDCLAYDRPSAEQKADALHVLQKSSDAKRPREGGYIKLVVKAAPANCSRSIEVNVNDTLEQVMCASCVSALSRSCVFLLCSAVSLSMRLFSMLCDKLVVHALAPMPAA